MLFTLLLVRDLQKGFVPMRLDLRLHCEVPRSLLCRFHGPLRSQDHHVRDLLQFLNHEDLRGVGIEEILFFRIL
jgi:hypothetical protein